jgi:hypothetical protein
MRLRSACAAALGASLLISSPGLGPYQALAQTIAEAPASGIASLPVSPSALNGSQALAAVRPMGLSLPVVRAAVPAPVAPLGRSAVAKAFLSRGAQASSGLFRMLGRRPGRGEGGLVRPSAEVMSSDSGARGWAGESFDWLAFGRKPARGVSGGVPVSADGGGGIHRGGLRPAGGLSVTSRREVPRWTAAARPYLKPVLTAALLLVLALALSGCSPVPGMDWLANFSLWDQIKKAFTLKSIAIQIAFGIVSGVIRKQMEKRAKKQEKARREEEARGMYAPSSRVEAKDIPELIAGMAPEQQPKVFLFNYDTGAFQEIAARNLALFASTDFDLVKDDKTGDIFVVPKLAKPELSSEAPKP